MLSPYHRIQVRSQNKFPLFIGYCQHLSLASLFLYQFCFLFVICDTGTPTYFSTLLELEKWLEIIALKNTWWHREKCWFAIFVEDGAVTLVHLGEHMPPPIIITSDTDSSWWVLTQHIIAIDFLRMHPLGILAQITSLSLSFFEKWAYKLGQLRDYKLIPDVTYWHVWSMVESWRSNWKTNCRIWQLTLAYQMFML